MDMDYIYTIVVTIDVDNTIMCNTMMWTDSLLCVEMGPRQCQRVAVFFLYDGFFSYWESNHEHEHFEKN